MIKEPYQVFPVFQKNIFKFIKVKWGLTPQKLKPEYMKHLKDGTPLEDFKCERFQTFIKGKHLSWQQFLTFRSVQLAVNGLGNRKISIVS